MRPSSHLLVLACLVVSGTAHAQRLLDVVDGVLPRDGFGSALADLGDLDGDGFHELLVSAPGDWSGVNVPPRAYVLSGTDRSILFSAAGARYRAAGPAGDVDGDGTDDWILGAEEHNGASLANGLARVYSGATGSLLHEFTNVEQLAHFGASVASVGDLNGDGRPDLAFGAPFQNVAGTSRGWVWFYSGLDGALLHTSRGTVDFANYGSSLCPLGDVDGDGIGDLAVAAEFDDTVEDDAGSVTLLSGATFGTIRTLLPAIDSRRFGRDLASPGDVDQDGFRDLLVGTGEDGHGPLVPVGSGPTLYRPSSVTLYSGATGAVLYRTFGLVDGVRFVLGLNAIGDVDGDGIGDWSSVCAPLSPQSGGPGLSVHSGADGRQLYRLDSESSFGGFVAACSAGDLDGDGLGEFVVGSPNWTLSLAVALPGRIRIHGGGSGPVDFTDLCNGDGGDQLGCTSCPCGNDAPVGTIGGCLGGTGTSARLDGSGDPSVSLPAGSTLDLRFSLEDARPNTFAVLRSGTVVPPADLAHPCYGADSGTRSLSLDGLRCAGGALRRHGARATDAAGDAGATTPPWGGEGAPAVGLGASAGFLAGQIRFFQAWYRDDPALACGRGLNTTQAQVVVFRQ